LPLLNAKEASKQTYLYPLLTTDNLIDVNRRVQYIKDEIMCMHKQTMQCTNDWRENIAEIGK